MNINSQYSFYPPQPDNPTDAQRHVLSHYALASVKRPEDFNYIRKLMSPPPDITHYVNPGTFKNIRVGIIGGGLAGLSAAFELRKAGFNITVLDALTDRVGGRVYTYYFDRQKSLYGEFGPMRIPVTHETVWHYLKLFKLPTRPFIQFDSNAYVYLRNTRVRNDPNGTNVMKYIYPKYCLSDQERNINWKDLLSHSIDSHLLFATANERAEILKVKPCYNNKTLFWDENSSIKMMELSGLSQEAIGLSSSFLPLLYNNKYNSYIDFIEENYPVNLSYLYEIPGGMQRLPLSFFNSLVNPNPIEYNGINPMLLGRVKWNSGCQVSGIHRGSSDEKVKLSYKCLKNGTAIEEEFDYIICTIPFSALRTVSIDPLFSNMKMRAIREVNYTTAQKTLLLFSQRFWEMDGIIGGSSITDLPISSIWYTSNAGKSLDPQKASLPGVILGSFNFELDAVRLSNMPEEERFELVKRNIEEVHGLQAGYLDHISKGFKTVNWDDDPNFRGSLCFFTPEQKRIFSYCMATPEYNERIFFAGEHISAAHRWMQGALQTGMQAANDLASACIKHIK